MNVPAWALAQKAIAGEPGEAHILSGRQNSVRRKIASPLSFWRIDKADFYTCVPPADLSYAPEALRAVREVEPSVQVIWRKQRWFPPGDPTPSVLAVHVGIARYVPYTKTNTRMLDYVEMPVGHGGPAPNLLECVFTDDETETARNGGPRGYQPFDMETARYLIEAFSGNKSPEKVDEEWMQAAFRRQEAADRERREKAAAGEEVLEWADKKLSDLTLHDEQEILRYQHDLERRRREKGTGLSNPFVVLGRG